MDNYQRVIDLAKELIASVEARNGLLMQQKIDALELAYKEEFRDSLYCYEAIFTFVLMNLASAKYFAHNNMFALAHERYEEVSTRMGGFMNSKSYSDEQKSEVNDLFGELEKIHKSTPERHQNLVVGRNDTRCCLCRVMPANKTGSHMVPNFLAHPTFSWDGEGKRFHEALNHDFINAQDRNCQFYGREVLDWRFALGEGKKDVTEEDIKKNVNQLEFDNEFCSHCENRFGVLEMAYSQFYNGQQKKIHPRVAYLFWLSILWRMSMGSMSIFMDIHEELALHKLLDDNMLNTVKEIEESDTDLADWRYAMYKTDNLRDGDKGILGYRKECSPYVVMYNDLVMVFYHHNPTDEELTIGPISVQREMLNDWHSEEKSLKVNRRWFWDVRDWIDESYYDFYDPAREKALISIREIERSENRVIDAQVKAEAIKVERLTMGPQEKMLRIRKLPRILGVWMRKKEAEEKGVAYDPLNDEDMFLQQRDFDQYYHDLAALSRDPGHHSDIVEFPFYKEARMAISNERDWEVSQEAIIDSAFMDSMKDYLGNLSPKELEHLINGVQVPYINPFARIGKNDPCPCGSGKKYKKCCGKDI